MKASLWGLALATFVGCAHGWPEAGTRQDVRGSVQVAHQARLVIAGPASYVHTSVDGGRSSIALFVVDAINGDDRDCAPATAAGETPAVREGRGGVRVPKGRALCVASAQSTEVFWHAHVEAAAPAVALQ